jgi:ubiquinone/menaquinone biosynthesis C-methylase UbiE
MNDEENKRWTHPSHAMEYLARADRLPHRIEGEAVILELLPEMPRRILDLGTGDGRLLALVKMARPQAQGVALDFSPTMLAAVRKRFADDPSVTVLEHNMENPLPDLEPFDCVVSSFAIHHLKDDRKVALYSEIFQALAPGGVFCNLEHVTSPSQVLHEDFLRAMGKSPSEDDPSNRCASAAIQLAWLEQIGFDRVDCYWKWREYALLAGYKAR